MTVRPPGPLPRPRSRRASFAVRALLVLGLAAGVAVVDAAPAGAHDEVGTVTVAMAEATTTASGTASVSYVVDVVYVNDGHPASDATVTVVAEGPAAVIVGPVAMTETATPGRYGATVDFPAPGPWTVRFTSLTPLATAETTQDVGAPATSTSASTTPPVPTLPVASTAASPSTPPTITSVTGTVNTGGPGSYEPDDFADTGTRVLLIAGLVAVLGAAGALALVRRRGRTR